MCSCFTSHLFNMRKSALLRPSSVLLGLFPSRGGRRGDPDVEEERVRGQVKWQRLYVCDVFTGPVCVWCLNGSPSGPQILTEHGSQLLFLRGRTAKRDITRSLNLTLSHTCTHHSHSTHTHIHLLCSLKSSSWNSHQNFYIVKPHHHRCSLSLVSSFVLLPCAPFLHP